ncbi:MAG TPA: TVP38/TMEM64 family protein [Candidatus Binatia bacterium]|nr:TVP38/TMEM64 family protein [Candidatus Binatia bacterium]
MVEQKKQTTGQNRRLIWLAVGILVLLFGMAAAWKWTPLADQIDIGRITGWALSLRDNPSRPVIILAGYLIGSLLLVPITVLIIATALVFGPVLGSAYSLAGCFLGAGATYALGYFLGRDLVQRITGSKRWEHVEQKIAQAGIMAVATMRLIPVAPFTVVNVISGAFQVPIRDYILGSLLGLTPGILVINLFAYQMEDAVRNPGMGSLALLGGLVVISGLAALWLRRRLNTDTPKEMASS